jgi:signal peptidase I
LLGVLLFAVIFGCDNSFQPTVAIIEKAPPGSWVETLSKTGSMEPYIHGTDLLVLKIYDGTALSRGTVVVFNRGDFPRVLHTVVARSGDYYYFSGYANKYSDGWFNKDKISQVLVGIIRK